jgi:glycolate oxidase iron-sulfur subunit
VHIPSTQTCCGALHQHGGDLVTAEMLGQQNRIAFEKLNVRTIITTASGCGVQLAEFGARQKMRIRKTSSPLAVGDKNSFCDALEAQRNDFSSCIIDISKFLASADGWDDVEIMPLPAKIAVHDPCSLSNVLRDQTYAYDLLARIPDLQQIPLAGNDQCCGAAGTYFIDQPEMAMKLQADKISAVIDSNIRYLATSNIGCSLHIASGLKATNVEVLHPVSLLARQMGIE